MERSYSEFEGGVVMSRLTKLDRMSIEQKTAEAIKFWASPIDAAFPPETIAITFE